MILWIEQHCLCDDEVREEPKDAEEMNRIYLYKVSNTCCEAMSLSLFAGKKRLCLAGNWAHPHRIASPQDSRVKTKDKAVLGTQRSLVVHTRDEQYIHI